MSMHDFSDPPTGVVVRHEGDTVTIASHESLLRLPDKTPIRFLRMGCAGVGVVFCLTGVATMWLFDAPFRINGEPVSKLLGTLFLVGFMAAWIATGLFILHVVEQVFVFRLLWRIPPTGWILRLDGNQWVAKIIPPFGKMMKTRQLTPTDISEFRADKSGCLVASLLEKEVPITTPLEPEVAEWLRVRLSSLL